MPAVSAATSPARRRSSCGRVSEPAARSGGSRAEEGLVGVDVADARDRALVQQQRLDRPRAPAGERAQVLCGEARIERLEAEACVEEGRERVIAGEQLRGAEAPRVGDREARAARLQQHAHARVRGLWLGVHEHGAGHTQVLCEVELVLEAPKQVLAASAEALHAPAAQGVLELRRRHRARPARVEDLDLCQRLALHDGR